MAEIRFTSEFSTYSTSSTTLRVLSPEMDVVFSNRYDLPGIQPVVNLGEIIEEDMRRRGITMGRYMIDGKYYDMIYREGDDDIKAEDYARDHFLMATSRLVIPSHDLKDFGIPVYCERDNEYCMCSYYFMKDDDVMNREMRYPLAKGFDEVMVYASNIEGLPAMVNLRAGNRKMTIIFCADGKAMLPVDWGGGMQTVDLCYTDIMGHRRHIISPAVITQGIDYKQTTAKISGRERLVSVKNESTVKLKFPGLPLSVAIEAGELMSRRDVTVRRYDAVKGLIEELALVKEVSGDISDERGKLNEISITYSRG